MNLPKSKVYIQTDAQNCITRCEGGYTTPVDLTNWIEIDSGTGDKFNLCQSNYFPEGLYTQEGVCRYQFNPKTKTTFLRQQKDIQLEVDSIVAKNLIASQIQSLKTQITETDYKIIKCYEYSLVNQPLPYDIAQLHTQRQELRDKINILESK